MTYLNTKCQVTGKPKRLFVECSPEHLSQVLRNGWRGYDAALHAEQRYKQAQHLRKVRRYRQTAQHAERIATAIELGI